MYSPRSVAVLVLLVVVAHAGLAAEAASDTPRHGGIAFVGSSSIMFWFGLKADFPALPVFRFGVAGANLHHVTGFTRKFVLGKRPRIVVVYAGENDLTVRLPGYDRSPRQVLNAFAAFTEAVHAALPETWIIFLAMKPAPSRSDDQEALLEANALIAEHVDSDRRLFYLDANEALCDTAGTVRRDLFRRDGLHLKRSGYEAWSRIIGPVLEEAYDRHTARFTDW